MSGPEGLPGSVAICGPCITSSFSLSFPTPSLSLLDNSALTICEDGSGGEQPV